MKRLLLLTISVFLFHFGFAQDAAEETSPSFSLSGSVDAYFRQNLTTKNLGGAAPGTSFANNPGFALGMVNLIGAYEGEKAGVVADLVFGPRGEDAVFASAASSNIVNQLYAYWNVSDKVTLTLGNFNTFLGYEVISPTGNFNYSTSYMFSYGPFSHTGVKADIALSDNWSLMLGVMNPTDLTEFNPVNTYTLGGQLGYSAGNGSAYLNLLYGDQDGRFDEDLPIGGTSAGSTFQIDLTTGWDLTDALYLGFNTTLNSTGSGEVATVSNAGVVTITDSDAEAFGFGGAAAYLQYRTSDMFALGFRGEYFSEFEGGASAIGGYDENNDASVIALTVSGNINIDKLTIIPELRLDSASEDVFPDSSFGPTNSLTSFLIAAVYAF